MLQIEFGYLCVESGAGWCYKHQPAPNHHEPQGGPKWLTAILAGWSDVVSVWTAIARVPEAFRL